MPRTNAKSNEKFITNNYLLPRRLCYVISHFEMHRDTLTRAFS